MEFVGGQKPFRRPARRKTEADDGIARCKHCLEKIIWAYPVPSPNARSAAGLNPKPMPLNYEPDLTVGLYTLYNEAPSRDHPRGCVRTGKLARGQVAGYRASGKPTYERHFKTCPKKEDWGRQGKAYSTRDVAR